MGTLGSEPRIFLSFDGCVASWRSLENDGAGGRGAGIGEGLVLRGGAMAGAKIECIVRVNAIRDGGKSPRMRQFIQNRKKFIFAEIAAVGAIGAVGRILHLARLDAFMAHAQLGYELFDHLLVV